MKATTKTLTRRAAWKALAQHSKEVKKLHLRELFPEDAKRGEGFTAEAAVELGKALAQRIIPELEAPTEPKLNHDSSTNNLNRRYRKLKKTL